MSAVHMPCGCPYPKIGDHRPCEHGDCGTCDGPCVRSAVPDAAVTAAAEAIHFRQADAETSRCDCLPEHPTARYAHDRKWARRALESAAPFIAASEREGIRQQLLNVVVEHAADGRSGIGGHVLLDALLVAIRELAPEGTRP